MAVTFKLIEVNIEVYGWDGTSYTMHVGVIVADKQNRNHHVFAEHGDLAYARMMAANMIRQAKYYFTTIMGEYDLG